MTDVRVETWAELQEALFADAWQGAIKRWRSTFAFRGRGDASDDLRNSLLRLGGNAGDLEGHIVRAFRKYAALDAVPRDTIWDWLALGQHHGLPTRLLDFTFSPYVALHFVTNELALADVDGAVWCVDYVRLHDELPDDARALLDREGADVFTTELLARIAPDLEELSRFDDFVAFVEPPSFDARIVNQYALFALGSRPELSVDAWLAERPELWRRVIVPAELKWEVRDKLDLANVTERVLFPGLDGLSRWLKRYYLPRDDA
jgi:hypothetical protein